MRHKKKGLAAQKQTNPKHKENIRQLNFSKVRIRNQQLIFKFSKEYPTLTFDEADAILLFVSWFQDNKYIIRRKK